MNSIPTCPECRSRNYAQRRCGDCGHRDPKPMRIWRHVTMWNLMEGEVTDHPDSLLNHKVVWEPLQTHAPEDAEPYCCYLSTVIFYEGRAWGNAAKEITRCTHYDLNTVSPSLLFVENRWWEVLPGKVVWRNGQWCFMHVLAQNTREARRANLGHLHFLDGERQLAELRRREG
jgi:hypothetical protein